ncbi:MAG: OsmC family protein [Saprospiraceae bacterium]
MITSSIRYEGSLHTTAVHVRSGNAIETDAPVDNQGKGEAFSPTDLLATSLASCALTTMGIVGNKNNINIDGASAEIIKHMASDPRRVSKIELIIQMPKDKSYTESEKELMERTALTCPVAKSLHPDLMQAIEVKW